MLSTPKCIFFKKNLFSKSLKTKETFLSFEVDIVVANHYINIEDRGGGTGGHGALDLWFNVKPNWAGRMV